MQQNTFYSQLLGSGVTSKVAPFLRFCRICNSAEPNKGICNPHSIANADINSSRISNSTELKSKN